MAAAGRQRHRITQHYATGVRSTSTGVTVLRSSPVTPNQIAEGTQTRHPGLPLLSPAAIGHSICLGMLFAVLRCRHWNT